MENASKALLMATEILLGVIIISILVFLYISWQNFADEMNKNIEENNISRFNSKFEVYDGRDNLTVHDIVTIISFANEYNKKSDASNYKIRLTSTNINISFDIVMNDTPKFIQDYTNNTFGFKIVSYNKETGIIDNMKIIKTK